MVKNQDMFPLLRKLGENTLVPKSLLITYIDDPSFYVTSEEEIPLMIQASDTFVKSDHNPDFLRMDSIYRHVRVLSNKLHIRHLKRDRK